MGAAPTPHAALVEALTALESCDAAHPSDGGRQWYDEKAVEAAIVSVRAALAQAEAAPDAMRELSVHLSHCNFGENAGACKYGDENCPALTERWRWFGDYLQRADRKLAQAEAAQPVVRNDPISALAIRLLVDMGHVSQEHANQAFTAACQAVQSEAQRMNVELPWVVAAPQPAAAAPKQEAATEPTDAQLIAAIKAASFHVTPQSLADMRAALKAAFALAAQPQQPARGYCARPGEPCECAPEAQAGCVSWRQQPAPEPVARVPLTGEQIDRCFGVHWRDESVRQGRDWHELGVRDAERAHGVAAPQTPAPGAEGGA